MLTQFENLKENISIKETHKHQKKKERECAQIMFQINYVN